MSSLLARWVESSLRLFFPTRMALFGRVAVCGAISQYNATEPAKGMYANSSNLLKVPMLILIIVMKNICAMHTKLA